jgi:hypothetical protein
LQRKESHQIEKNATLRGSFWAFTVARLPLIDNGLFARPFNGRAL